MTCCGGGCVRGLRAMTVTDESKVVLSWMEAETALVVEAAVEVGADIANAFEALATSRLTIAEMTEAKTARTAALEWGVRERMGRQTGREDQSPGSFHSGSAAGAPSL